METTVQVIKKRKKAEETLKNIVNVPKKGIHHSSRILFRLYQPFSTFSWKVQRPKRYLPEESTK